MNNFRKVSFSDTSNGKSFVIITKKSAWFGFPVCLLFIVFGKIDTVKLWRKVGLGHCLSPAIASIRFGIYRGRVSPPAMNIRILGEAKYSFAGISSLVIDEMYILNQQSALDRFNIYSTQ